MNVSCFERNRQQLDKICSIGVHALRLLLLTLQLEIELLLTLHYGKKVKKKRFGRKEIV